MARTILPLECLAWKFRSGGDEAVESAMICTAICISLCPRELKIDLITHHISHVILTCPFLRNETLDAEEDNCVILNRIPIIVKTTQEEEPSSIM